MSNQKLYENILTGMIVEVIQLNTLQVKLREKLLSHTEYWESLEYFHLNYKEILIFECK